jgi:hypothetical protein
MLHQVRCVCLLISNSVPTHYIKNKKAVNQKFEGKLGTVPNYSNSD